MASVEFIKLTKPEKARFLCELSEEFLLAGRRVLVVVQDDNQGVTLDRFMWNWNKGSFIPHAYDNGAVECIDEPVVIATQEENTNGANVLIMGKPCSLEFMRRFQDIRQHQIYIPAGDKQLYWAEGIKQHAIEFRFKLAGQYAC